MASPVSLVPTSRQHLSFLVRLWNDPEVMSWVGFPDGLGISDPDLETWFDRVEADATRHHFVVESAGELCGEAYYKLDVPPTTAALDIKLNPSCQGRGIATTALTQLIDLIFSSEAGVQSVWVEPSERNTAAQRLYRRCGLQPARRPDHLPHGDSYWSLERSTYSAPA